MYKIIRTKHRKDDSYNSRYKNYKTLVYSDQSEAIESYDGQGVKEAADDYNFIVTAGFINRLDLIAYKFYGDSTLYWVIARANNIKDVYNSCALGDVLRIPSIETVFSSGELL